MRTLSERVSCGSCPPWALMLNWIFGRVRECKFTKDYLHVFPADVVRRWSDSIMRNRKIMVTSLIAVLLTIGFVWGSAVSFRFPEIGNVPKNQRDVPDRMIIRLLFWLFQVKTERFLQQSRAVTNWEFIRKIFAVLKMIRIGTCTYRVPINGVMWKATFLYRKLK